MNRLYAWLLDFDVSVQYQVHKQLLGSNETLCRSLQNRIETEGFGYHLLSARNTSGHWGLWYYQPKWTCTHYTLCDLKNLHIRSDQPSCQQMVSRALTECQLADGGLNFAKSKLRSDIAINGMFLEYASYFCPHDGRLSHLDACIRSYQKPDGGFSWDYESSISDPHTTICALEGLHSYRQAMQGTPSIDPCIEQALACLYKRNLCIGEDARYTRLAYPYRYRYDLLRFLEFAATAAIPWNPHIEQALTWLVSKQKEGRWNLELIHPGNVHIEFEHVHQGSRFITLKALLILKHYSGSSSVAASAYQKLQQGL